MTAADVVPARRERLDFQVLKAAVSIDVDTSGAGFVRSLADLLLNDAEVAVNEPARAAATAIRDADRSE